MAYVYLLIVFKFYIKSFNRSTPSNKMANVDIMRVQKEELDALNNIYLHDLQIHRSTFPIKFTIACQPFSYVHQDQYRTKIHIQFTKEYPATAPRLQIQPLVGITQDNILAMERKVDSLISNTVNRPLVYDLVEAVRDWIQEYLVEGKDQIEQSKDEKEVQQVFERPKYETFTPVTLETFTLWKKAFDQQMAELKKKKQADDQKLTGKQWFMKNKQIHSDSDEEDEQQEEDEKQPDIQQ